MSASGDLSASVTLRRGVMNRVGVDRVTLIEAVAELGSIRAAAQKLGLSYKGAWDAIQALNNLFDGPLIEATPGGKSGGAAVVTARGRAVVAAFRRVQAEIDAALVKLEAGLAGDAPRDLFWSLGLRTSARNALRGVVTRITPDGVNGEVILRLGDGAEITAVLTRRSIEELGLEPGKPAIALIKASFVTLAKGENTRPSGPNQIIGVVTSREDGAANCEIGVDIGGGKTLTATITLQNARTLAIAVGDPVTALIEPSQVILAVE